MAYMKNIDLLLREKIENEVKLNVMKAWITLFLGGQLEFDELPFKVKLFLCEWEAERNCEELNSNVVAQLIIAKRNGFMKNVIFLKKKIKDIKNRFNNWYGDKGNPILA